MLEIHKISHLNRLLQQSELRSVPSAHFSLTFPYFSDEETKDRRFTIICSKSQSKTLAELGLGLSPCLLLQCSAFSGQNFIWALCSQVVSVAFRCQSFSNSLKEPTKNIKCKWVISLPKQCSERETQAKVLERWAGGPARVLTWATCKLFLRASKGLPGKTGACHHSVFGKILPESFSSI